jgi:O-acetyl-ADP-ribose deacetylase (regulator of RNase III)
MEISYLMGDATQPVAGQPTIIVHVCNDVGGWGKGFVLALSKRWPEPEKQYRAWYRGEGECAFGLGEVQFVQVEPHTWVANLIGQRGIRRQGGQPPVRYDAIRQGLRAVAEFSRQKKATVQMPRIGCGLAGGNWEEVGRIVQEELADQGVSVTVYDFAPEPS